VVDCARSPHLLKSRRRKRTMASDVTHAWLHSELDQYCNERAARALAAWREIDEIEEEPELEFEEIDLYSEPEDDGKRDRFYKLLQTQQLSWCSGPLNRLKVANLPHICGINALEKLFCKACASGKQDAAELLLTEFEGVINPFCMAQEALRSSAANGRTEICQFLLKVGLDPHLSGALRTAAEHGHCDVCRVFSLDLEDRPTRKDDMNSSLRLAARNGHKDCVSLLLDVGADPSPQRCRCLRLACSNGHAEIVQKLLLDDRVDETLNHCHAMRLALEKRHVEVVRTLAFHTTSWEAQKYLSDIVIAARRGGCPKCVKILLAFKNVQRSGADGIFDDEFNHLVEESIQSTKFAISFIRNSHFNEDLCIKIASLALGSRLLVSHENPRNGTAVFEDSGKFLRRILRTCE